MDTILFDLDGTLLPMEQEEFIKIYFGELAKKCTSLGHDAKPMLDAVWQGTGAMVKNDGSCKNETVFWETFASLTSPDITALRPAFDLFYAEEFNKAKAATAPNPYAAKVVSLLREKGYTVVLATNPLFPQVAVQTRLSWLGLDIADFDLVTSYENSNFCKPSPAYYQMILEKINKQPASCMMVGNDVQEDGCAKELGMDLYLVTDNLIHREEHSIDMHRNGSFASFYEFAKALPCAPSN